MGPLSRAIRRIDPDKALDHFLTWVVGFLALAIIFLVLVLVGVLVDALGAGAFLGIVFIICAFVATYYVGAVIRAIGSGDGKPDTKAKDPFDRIP